MTSSNMSSPSSSSVPLSPKLEERRNAREARDKPWRWGSKDYPEMTPPPRPAFRFKVTVHRKCGTAPKFPSEPFPFTKLPFDIQILVGEFAARYKTKVKVSGMQSLPPSSLTQASRVVIKLSVSGRLPPPSEQQKSHSNILPDKGPANP